MNIQRIRGFLIQLPKPAKIVVTTGDGDVQEMSPGRSWAKVAESIAALDPQLVQLLDKDDKLLRAQRYDDEDSRRSAAAPIPAGLAADPHALMLTHFADLLHRAYEHTTEVAFTRLVEMADRMNERAESIEQRLERAEAQNRRLLQDRLTDELDRVQEEREQQQGGGIGEQMISAFMGGGGFAAPGPHKANGHKSTNGKAGA